MKNEILYNNIKYLCKRDGITVALLEKELGMAVSTIGKWGKSIPSSDKLYAVSQYFNHSMEMLITVILEEEALEDLFIDKLISKTLKGDIKWDRTQADSNEISYKCYYKNGCILIVENMDENKYFGCIQDPTDKVYIRQNFDSYKIKELIKICRIKEDKFRLFMSDFINNY